MRYDVKTPLYEGPLPLLVELARYDLIDLFLTKLVDLTQDYLSHIQSAGMALNDLAEPLPLLGNLAAIKARRLLPAPLAPEEDEEVPISLEELERRLQDYEQFKTVAQLLSELHALQHRLFSRPRATAPETEATGMSAPEAADTGFPVEVEIGDLVSAFTKVLEESTASVYEVRAEPWTLESKIQELRVKLLLTPQLRFSELFRAHQSTLELVVTFLALLELMRQRVVRAVQERPFAQILIALREPQPNPIGSHGTRAGETDR